MARIAFVTDSTAYLTKQQQTDLEIHVVPLTVVLEGKGYREGVDINPAEFYDLLSKTKEFPKTSQPSPGEFVEVFKQLVNSHDTVLVYLLSGEFSGTVNSARQAAEMVGGDIRIVDSRITSFCLSGPLVDAVLLARAGASADDIVRMWEDVTERQHAYFVVDSLELLHRGGRIGGAAAVVGSLLQVKPILTIRDGRVELFEKVRTRRRAVERIVGLLDEAAKSGGTLRVGVVHTCRPQEAEELRAQLLQAHPGLHVDISELGPVVGAHVGPGVIALLFYEMQGPRHG